MAQDNTPIEFETVRQNKRPPREKKAMWILD